MRSPRKHPRAAGGFLFVGRLHACPTWASNAGLFGCIGLQYVRLAPDLRRIAVLNVEGDLLCSGGIWMGLV